MEMMYYLSVFGATGAVGQFILDIYGKIKSQKNIKIYLLTAFSNVDKMVELIKKYKPEFVFLFDSGKNDKLYNLVQSFESATSVCRNINEVLNLFKNQKGKNIRPVILNGIMGHQGLIPSLLGFLEDFTEACANKESIVLLGELFHFLGINKPLAETLFPLDSEHFSLYKLLKIFSAPFSGDAIVDNIKKVIITASGGIFYPYLKEGKMFEELGTVEIDKLMNHPNWRMGKRITVDSSTGVNKCFEIIEAYFLYGIPLEKIEVKISRRSFIHSAIADNTESLYMDISHPDMHQSVNYFFRNILNIETSYPFKPLETYTNSYELEEYDLNFFKLSDFVLKNYSASDFFGTKLIVVNELLQDQLFENKIDFRTFILKFMDIMKKIQNLPVYSEQFLLSFKNRILQKRINIDDIQMIVPLFSDQISKFQDQLYKEYI